MLDHENAASHSVTVTLDGTICACRRHAPLGVTTRETPRGGDYEVEYRLKGGEAHPFVTVSPAGLVGLHAAPSHEATPALRFEVEARYRQAGQADDAGWGAAREISIAVGDVDEAATGLALDVGHVQPCRDPRYRVASIKLRDLAN